MYEIAIIERYSPSHFGWSNLIRDKRIPNMSIEEILSKYQGFEGEVVLYFLIGKEKEALNEIVKKCLESKNFSNCVMLHVIPEENASQFLIEQAVKVGYDVGVFIEDSAYSSIFNEILFGHLSELIAYKNYLNENLLFQDRFIAKQYVALHNALSAQKKGVEDWMEMSIYEVWKQKI